jgi:hypothetical protein
MQFKWETMMKLTDRWEQAQLERKCRIRVSAILQTSLLLAGGVLLACTACRSARETKDSETKSALSVAEAQQIPLEFEGKYEAAPRGFGKRLDQLVKQYRTLSPVLIERCFKPAKRLTNAQISFLANSGPYGSASGRRYAGELYIQGQLRDAMQIIRRMPFTRNFWFVIQGMRTYPARIR